MTTATKFAARPSTTLDVLSPARHEQCSDDLCVWADRTQCYAFELDEYGFMSDGFEREPYFTDWYVVPAEL
jgi:hypothetical protein